MKALTFKEMYDETTELNGGQLEWEWDESEHVFRATASNMCIYILRPTHAILEVEPDSTEDEDEYADE